MMYLWGENMILRKLYRGNIHPGEQSQPLMWERSRKEEAFLERYQTLLDQLETPLQKECRTLIEEANSISAYDCEQAYIEGMRMGAQLAAELLMSKE